MMIEFAGNWKTENTKNGRNICTDILRDKQEEIKLYEYVLYLNEYEDVSFVRYFCLKLDVEFRQIILGKFIILLNRQVIFTQK